MNGSEILLNNAERYASLSAELTNQTEPMIQSRPNIGELIKPSSQYHKNTRCECDTLPKRRDRIFFFYPCVVDALVGASGLACLKFLAQKTYYFPK